MRKQFKTNQSGKEKSYMNVLWGHDGWWVLLGLGIFYIAKPKKQIRSKNLTLSKKIEDFRESLSKKVKTGIELSELTVHLIDWKVLYKLLWIDSNECVFKTLVFSKSFSSKALSGQLSAEDHSFLE